MRRDYGFRFGPESHTTMCVATSPSVDCINDQWDMATNDLHSELHVTVGGG